MTNAIIVIPLFFLLFCSFIVNSPFLSSLLCLYNFSLVNMFYFLIVFAFFFSLFNHSFYFLMLLLPIYKKIFSLCFYLIQFVLNLVNILSYFISCFKLEFQYSKNILFSFNLRTNLASRELFSTFLT